MNKRGWRECLTPVGGELDAYSRRDFVVGNMVLFSYFGDSPLADGCVRLWRSRPKQFGKVVRKGEVVGGTNRRGGHHLVWSGRRMGQDVLNTRI